MSQSAEALLAAADELLGEKPWSKISLGQIATRAGVSRQTLYNEFSDRRGFARAFVLREADRLLVGPEREITRGAGDPRAALAGALRTFLEQARENRLLAAMRAEDDNGLLALVTTQGEVLTAASERLLAHALATWPGLDIAGTRELMDVVVRLGISHANQPAADPQTSAASIVAVIGPRFEELFARLRKPRAA